MPNRHANQHPKFCRSASMPTDDNPCHPEFISKETTLTAGARKPVARMRLDFLRPEMSGNSVFEKTVTFQSRYGGGFIDRRRRPCGLSNHCDAETLAVQDGVQWR